MKAVFRLLVVVSMILAGVAQFVDQRQLPAAVQAALTEARRVSPPSALREALDVAIVVAGLGSLIGLCLFKKWGRLLYVVLISLSSVTMFAQPVVISSGSAFAFIFLSAVLNGSILMMSYLPPLSAHFETARHKPGKA